MKMKAKSGIIIWVTTLVLLAATVAIAVMYNDFDGIASYLLVLIIMAASTIMTASFIMRNYLIVNEQTIKVCFGMTTTVLEIASVTSLKKVISLTASASASVKRIEIQYAGGGEKKHIYVSPKDEAAFIQAVGSANPKVKVL